MEVIGIDERIKEKPKYVDKLFSPSELDKQLKNADFVVLTIPHTPKTEGLFNLEKFKLMKESAYFINIGRGMTAKISPIMLTRCFVNIRHPVGPHYLSASL